MQKKLADQEKNFEQFSRAFEEEAKVVEVMEKMVASQQDDQSILEKYSHQDNARIKVRKDARCNLLKKNNTIAMSLIRMVRTWS